MDDILKAYEVNLPSAGTNVHTSRGPARAHPMASDRLANFFARSNPVKTPGSGNLLKGNPKVKSGKSGRKRRRFGGRNSN
jgi:hypothetical protein